MLTRQQIDTYHEQGFIVVANVFDPRHPRSRCVPSWPTGSVARTLPVTPTCTTWSPTIRRNHPRCAASSSRTVSIRCSAKASRARSYWRSLSSCWVENIRLQNSKLNVKAPGFGSPVEWHQDWAFYPHTNEDVLAVGVMIEDVRMDNGPMMVVPGSHTGPVYNHHADGRFCGAMDPSECDIDFSNAVPCIGSAGTVTLHQARLVHGSAQNTSSHPRPFLLYECMAADAWPLMGVPDLNEFDSRIICGEPTLQPRLVGGIPVRMPLPAALNQGSIYENQTAIKNRYFADKAPRPSSRPRASSRLEIFGLSILRRSLR